MRICGRDIRWTTLDAIVRDKAHEHGDAVFAEVDGAEVSHRALEERSRRVGLNLVAAGVALGDRVATLMFNSAELLLMMFAVPRIGAVWTPINAGLMAQDLAYTLRDCGAEVLVVDTELADKLDALPPDLLGTLRIFVAGGEAGRHSRFEELERDVPDGELPETRGRDPAVILYTGGTTGLPKGVVLTQASFILAGMRYGETFSVKAGERHYTTLPLFHAAAIQFGIMGPLVCGMTTAIDRRFSASSYWARVRETGATVVDPIGTMVGLLLAQPVSDRDREHAVRVGIGIVGQVPPAIPEEFTRRFGIPLVTIYGLTEAGGAMITGNRLGDDRQGSNGRTHGWAELRIADEHDTELPAGEVGEILLRPTYPDMFMAGYWNNPAKTLETFRNLWLHTGDLGRVDPDGFLTFVGRHAHWIRRRGENVSAYEVEDVLSAYAAVEEIVVVGVPSAYGEDDIKAFVIARSGEPFDPIAFCRWAAERLAPFKLPRYIELVTELPRSVTKREIERSKLKGMGHERAFDREAVLGRASSQTKARAREHA